MVQQIEPMAIKHNNDWYRCNKCGSMFSYMVVFRGWDFVYKVPRCCPNCRAIFKNGNIDIE